MFDDVYGMAGRCAENFRSSVRDSFGASILSDVLDPICNEIGMLRAFQDDYQRQSLHIQQALQEARSLCFDGSCPQ
jgi:hypothetical protein